MHIETLRGRPFLSQTSTAVNSNSASVTTALDLRQVSRVGWTVDANTGTHATHVITFQGSNDNTNWHDTTNTVTGTGIKEHSANTRYGRLKVTTVEGAASTVNIIIAGKG